jgi:hypothetical protein
VHKLKPSVASFLRAENCVSSASEFDLSDISRRISLPKDQMVTPDKSLVLVHFQTGIVRQTVRIEAGFSLDTVREVALTALEKAVSFFFVLLLLTLPVPFTLTLTLTLT